MQEIDVLIIGAGAAGLMCAIEASKRKRKVFVLDHANKAGKKILMSGAVVVTLRITTLNPTNIFPTTPIFSNQPYRVTLNGILLSWLTNIKLPSMKKH